MTGLDFNLYDENALKTPIRPAWTVLGKKNKADMVKWFQETKDSLEAISQHRIDTHVNNLLWYTGEYDRTLEYRLVVPGRNDVLVPRRILPRIINHLYDITEQRVSKLSRYKPAFDVFPANAEQSDRDNARVMKLALQALVRREMFDFLLQGAERWSAVFGETLVDVDWEEDAGDRKGPNTYERVGDVGIRLREPWTWLPEPKRSRDQITWGVQIFEILHVEEARKKYKAPKLEPDQNDYIFKFNQGLHEKRTDEVVIYRVIQKPCMYMPDGNMTYIANDTVIDIKDKYPYSHNDFPFEWHTDIDVPGRLFPLSFYQHLKPIQNIHNRLSSIITRNILITGHPHVLMPKGAAKIEAFANTTTAIEYNGPIEPKVVTWSSVPPEMFSFRDQVAQELNQVSGVQGVTRGQPPSNTRAASMLRFYEEQEEQRASTQILKHNELIRRVLYKAASIIGDYYPKTGDARLRRIVGEENQYLLEAFKAAKISSEYDIVIQNSTGFSESMAGRMEEVQMLLQMSPGILSPEQVADVLELKNPQKAYDISTNAIKLAQFENERFLAGKEVPEPTSYQDLVTHWRTHLIMMNAPDWLQVPEDRRRQAELHVQATEMLMEEKAKANQAFAQKLAMLSGYPAFYALTPQVPELQTEPPPPPAAPQGEQMEGMDAPAEPPMEQPNLVESALAL